MQAADRVHVEREPALVLVQADGDSLRAPVREQRLHVRVDGVGPDDELGVVADALLPLVCRGQVGLLDRCAERDVADGVVGVRGRIGLPHLDARLHELAHRRLEVVVADDAAGDSGRPGARLRLVEHDDCPRPSRAPRDRSSLARWYAVESPWMPAPTTT